MVKLRKLNNNKNSDEINVLIKLLVLWNYVILFLNVMVVVVIVSDVNIIMVEWLREKNVLIVIGVFFCCINLWVILLIVVIWLVFMVWCKLKL